MSRVPLCIIMFTTAMILILYTFIFNFALAFTASLHFIYIDRTFFLRRQLNIHKSLQDLNMAIETLSDKCNHTSKHGHVLLIFGYQYAKLEQKQNMY